MKSVPPGPEFDRLRQEMDRRGAAVERELLTGPSFPVYEAHGSGLRDRAVGAFSASDLVLDMVELVRGEGFFSASEPMIAVRSQPHDVGFPKWEPEDLADVLARERDERADETGVDVPEPTLVEERRIVLLVDGVETPADVRIEGECWAAVLGVVAPSVHVQVLVSARRVPLERVLLERATSLAPYVLGKRERTARRQETETYVEPEELDLPEVAGFRAHRELIDSILVHTAELDQGMEDRRLRRRRSEGEGYGRRWESAVRAQIRLAGQDRADADAAVAALVNHMIQLGLRAGWFAEPGAREAAIEESIRWTVFDSDVSSRPAQEAWLATWRTEQVTVARHFLDPGDHDAVRDAFDTRHDGRRTWSEAWKAWCRARAT